MKATFGFIIASFIPRFTALHHTFVSLFLFSHFKYFSIAPSTLTYSKMKSFYVLVTVLASMAMAMPAEMAELDVRPEFNNLHVVTFLANLDVVHPLGQRNCSSIFAYVAKLKKKMG